MGLHVRHRLRLHAGSDFEVLDRLGDYGITPKSIPSTFGGEWKASDFAQWIEARSRLELARNQEA